MNIINTILERKSQPLVEGEIDPASLEAIFKCALTAPDHKRLRPWKFIVCNPEQKSSLQRMIVEAKQLESEAERLAYMSQVERKLNFAPHIIICLLEINRGGVVPEIEQILSAGASIQNMIIAAEALGFNCYWKTGEWAYNPALRERLGLNSNTVITGFLGLGRQASPESCAKPIERPSMSAHFTWLDESLVRTEPCLGVQ